MPRLTPVLRSTLGGVSFAIRCDSPPLVAGLSLRWRALPPGPRRPDLLFDACFRPRRPRLVLNGRSRCVARDANHLLAELELAIYAEVCQRTATTPIHAAAVAFGEEAVLIAGASGAGKSTLAWHLTQLGGSYLAEEHVFLDAQSSLSGLPRALSFANTQGEDLGLAWAPRVRHSAPRIGLVVLLELPRSPSSLRRLGPAEAAAGLAQHLHRPPRSDDLNRLVDAVSGVRAFALAQEGVEAALACIGKHLPQA